MTATGLLRTDGGGSPRPRGAAARIAPLLEPFLGGELPVHLTMWDGSTAGPAAAPHVVVRSRRALRRLLWSPGELGLAQAYVTGELDVEGDLASGLSDVWGVVRDRRLVARRPTPRELASAAATALRLGVVGPPPAAPRSQARVKGRLHSRSRDVDAIAHHYDLSNAFYELVLDPQMAYSCGYWTSDAPGYGLEDAQRDKLDLVSRKLGLRPGMRVLDVGCGWGSFSLHAAATYGVSVVGVTLSKEQRDFVARRVAERGLGDRVEVRLQDYRDVADGPFDAIATLEMGEHVGAENYPVFAGRLHTLVRPGGRVLVQQMSRRTRPGGGDFIERYIAPDMHMRPVGETVALLEDAGLEVRDVEAMREHYVRTVDAWYDTFERRYDDVVALVGPELARVWRLYLVGGSLAFREGRMGVDQILSVRQSDSGASEMPLVRDWTTAGRLEEGPT